MYKIILIFILCFCALTDAKFSICTSSVGEVIPNTIAVTGCDSKSAVCKLKRGTNVTIEFDFTVKKSVQNATAIVHGVVLGTPILFPLSDNDFCHDLINTNASCPLEPNHGKYHYKASLPVLYQYPRITVTVEWELQNENKEDITCILIAAKID